MTPSSSLRCKQPTLQASGNILSAETPPCDSLSYIETPSAHAVNGVMRHLCAKGPCQTADGCTIRNVGVMHVRLRWLGRGTWLRTTFGGRRTPNITLSELQFRNWDQSCSKY